MLGLLDEVPVYIDMMPIGKVAGINLEANGNNYTVEILIKLAGTKFGSDGIHLKLFGGINKKEFDEMVEEIKNVS
jgi:hypothetical protein